MTRPKVKKQPRGAFLSSAETLRVLRFLTEFQREHGMSPTARELAGGLGYSSSSVAQYRLDSLLQRGLVVVEVGRSRSVRVTEAGFALIGVEPCWTLSQLRDLLPQAVEETWLQDMELMPAAAFLLWLEQKGNGK